MVVMLVFPLACGTGCDEEVQKEFMNAALSGIESGLKSIADGLISGAAIVATRELETSADSSDSSSEGEAPAEP